jgi:hypothetical protein
MPIQQARGIAPGTVAAPGLYLGTDTTSGVFQIGNGNIGLSIAGTKLLDLSSGAVAVTGTLATGNHTITGTLSVSAATTLSSTLGVTTSVDITGSSGTRSLLIKTGGIVSLYDSGNTEQARLQTTAADGLFIGTVTDNSITFNINSSVLMKLTNGRIVDIGTADVGIGFAKVVSVLAPTAAAGIVCKVPIVGYPILAAWNSADSGDNIFQYFYVNAAGDNKGSIAYNRGANVIAYNTTSDATLKNLIGDAPQARSLEILSQTRLREYSWKSDVTNKPQIGVIAQELVDVFPGAVSVGGDLPGTDEDGNPTTKYHPWSVDKTAYQFHLVAGWQSHEAKIAALEARLAALEAK